MLSHALRAKVQNGTIPAPTDPNFKQVSLLLHGDGTNGAQNNTFLDSSTNNFTVTRNGNTTQGTNTPFSQPAGYWSNYLNGSSSFNTPTNTALDFGTGDFTVEFWMNPADVASQQHLLYNGNWSIQFYTSGSLILYDGGVSYFAPTSATTLNQWSHVALSRSSGVLKGFYNGVQQFSYASSVSFNFSNSPIGARGGYTGYSGYLSNYRFIKGTGIYTASFTPPTTPLTAVTNTSYLICQSNYFKDNSSNNFALTVSGTPSIQPFSPFAPTAAYSTNVNGGSMYFDGAGDNLSVADNANLRFGTSAFTIQSWVYRNAAGTAHSIVSKGGASTGFTFGITSTNVLRFTNTTTNIDTTTTIPANAWTHVAAVRTNTSASGFQLYINGVSSATATVSTDFNQTETLYVGADRSATTVMNGYISNLRYVNGTAETITIPTAPLTAITNTQLLLNGTNAGIFDNASKNDLETVGNAQVSTAVTKFGTGSMKFAGSTTDVLKLPISKNLDFNTGDFTIEMWFNASNTGMGVLYEVTNYLSIRWSQASSTRVNISYDGAFRLNSNTTLSTNTWYHLALVRQSNTLKLYIDGVAQTTTYTLSYNLPDNGTFIGNYFAGGYPFNGYIDDLRVTKGVARYTANFTPPTAAFPNQ